MLPDKYDIQALFAEGSFEKVIKSINRFSKKENIVFIDGLKFGDIHFGLAAFYTGWINGGHTHTWNPEKFNIPVSEGKAAVCMFKTDSTWFLQLARNTGITEQTITKVSHINQITDTIKDQWKKGFDITNMCSNNDGIYMVCSKGLDLVQSYYISQDIPYDFIKKKVKEGQVLIDILDIGDSYLWMFSSNTAFNDMHFQIDPGYDKLIEIRDKIISDDGYNGYHLSFIRIVVGNLLFVFHK